MTIIHDEENENQLSRIALLVGVGIFALIGAGLTLFLVLRSRAPGAEKSVRDLTTEAQTLFKEERFSAVIETLNGHLAVMAEDEDVEGLRLFADACLKCPMDNNRHLGAAAEVYRRILGFAPDDLESARRLTEIYAAAGKTSDAIKYAEMSLEQAPSQVDWQLGLAELYSIEGRFDRSLTVLDKVLIDHPENRRALDQRIGVMIAAAKLEDEVIDFVMAHASQVQSDVLRDEMRLMYAQHVGNSEVSGMLHSKLADVEPVDQDHAQWLATAVLAEGNLRRAAEIQTEIGHSTDDWKPAVYRLLQQNEFAKVEDLLQPRQLNSDPEMLVVQFLCRWFARSGDLRPPLEQLALIDTQLSRAWHPLLVALQESQSAKQVLDLCNSALETFPGSPWLYLLKAQALVSMGEFDLAAQTYRIATRANPQWFQVRIELARLRLQEGDFASAFGEAVVAIRTSPESTVGYELAMVSALRAAAQDTPLSDQAESALMTALQSLQDAATDSYSRQVLPMVIMRLKNGKLPDVELIQSLLEEELTPGQLDVLRLLTIDRELIVAIESRQSDLKGIPAEELLQQAIQIASTDGLPAAGRFLAEVKIGGNPLPEIAHRLLYTQTVAADDPKAGRDEWLRLANDFAGNSRVLGAALRSSVVRNSTDERRQIIGLLKAATGDAGVQWQLEQVRLSMDEDDSDKVSSAAALKLVDLIEVAPECSEAYSLLAIAMERLDRPDKVFDTLSAAVSSGVDEPVFRVRLAELAVDRGRIEVALEHARHAMTAKSVNLRRRAAGVLLACNAYQDAAKTLEKDVLSVVTDTDDQFAAMTGLALAYANLGQYEGFAPRLTDLARASDRWFQLWVDMSVLSEVPSELSMSLLKEARGWATDRPVRLRRLAGAWRKLADRRGNSAFWKNAQEAIQAIQSGQRTTGDCLMLCGLYERLQNDDAAAELYREIAASQAVDRLRAIALNNLALIESRMKRFDRAETHASEALTIRPRPEFADTLSLVYENQKKFGEAVAVLRRAREQWPESDKLKNRLIEVQARL